MRQTLLLVSIFLFTFYVSAQKKFKKELDSITTTERAQEYLEAHKNRQNKIITFNEEKHKTRFAQELLKMRKGGTKVLKNEIENIHYKVIEKKDIIYYRVNYILLNGKIMPYNEIQSLRPKVIALIKSGKPFKDVASQYSMDTNRNRGGDSGWITHGDMLPEFEAQVMNDNHNVDDVFTVDVESNQWYYVVKKTFDKKSIREIKVLKVVESKR